MCVEQDLELLDLLTEVVQALRSLITYRGDQSGNQVEYPSVSATSGHNLISMGKLHRVVYCCNKMIQFNQREFCGKGATLSLKMSSANSCD